MSKRKSINPSQTSQEIVQEQYMAGRSLSFFESIGSIIATEVSALTFLGIPAFAFSKDFSFLQIYIGAIVGRLIIALLFLPKIYGKGLTIYGIMAKQYKNSENGQRITAIIYMVSKVLAVGVRLYSGSILIASFFNISIYLAILIITILTYFYTLVGGLKAVVRTDLLQAAVFISGGLIAHYLIPLQANTSWSYLWQLASDANKTLIIDFNNLLPFFIGFFGGLLFDMATHGVDQDFTQRLMACKSKKSAQLSIFLSSFCSIAVGGLFLGVGALLWSYYQLSPLPENISPDKLFAHFITAHFPTPIKGIMLAGVLAATMSTLDSTINALSSCLWNDILPHRNIKKIKKYLQIDTLVISVILLLIAYLASTSDQLLVLGLKVASWSGGALLALFFSSLVWPQITPKNFSGFNVICCYLFNLTGVALNTFILEGNWQLNIYYGFSFGTIFLIASKFISQTKNPTSKINGHQLN